MGDRVTGPPVCEWCPSQRSAPATFTVQRECLLGHVRTVLLCGLHTTSAMIVLRFCAECAPDRTVITLTSTPLQENP